ncbi:SRPBCC family protein [Streptomyces gobiensis]|uniref:SRPBCC family protein n=1 Tax=Streptomyces gobiensis TaxID=2875706 RepID=UPI001E54DC83|nr:SRPBCC family protein [Streptomyces gobiensis]UGY92284.1 SRPBCC family protein [Streptomyces gobiensis]
MPQVHVYVSIPLPVDEVFYFLADARNLPRWHSGVMEVHSDTNSGQQRVGGRTYQYRFPGRHRDFRLERCVYEPGVRIGFLGQRMWTPLGTQVPRFDFRLWPRGPHSCRVGVQVTSSLTGGLLLLWPVVAMGWRRDLPEDAQRLYEVLTGTEEVADVGFEPGRGLEGMGIGQQPRRSARRFRLPAPPAIHR